MELIEIQAYIKEISEGHIDWGHSFTNFRIWLPPFEIRVVSLFVLLGILLISIIIWHKRKTRQLINSQTKTHVKKVKKYKIPLINKKVSFVKLTHPLWTHKFLFFSLMILLLTTSIFILSAMSVSSFLV